MPVSADTLRLLMEKGLSGDDLVEIVAAIDADMIGMSGGIPVDKVDAVAERRRAYDRERKAKVRWKSGGIPPEVQCGHNSIGKLVEEVSEEKKEVVAAQRKSPVDKRGTRLPADWEPDADDWATASALGFSQEQAKRQFDKFRDHWIAKPGRDGSKLDWKATLRNWLRTSAERMALKPLVGPTPEPTGLITSTEEWFELLRKRAAQ